MTVRAHYSQGRVVLDEPGAFAEGQQLRVDVEAPCDADAAAYLARLSGAQGVWPVGRLDDYLAATPPPPVSEEDPFDLLMSLRAERRAGDDPLPGFLADA